MTDHIEVARVLEDAADLIERDGWWNPQHVETWGGGGTCALLAIERVAPKHHALDFLDAFARHLGLDDGAFIPKWNDAQETAQPVLDALRAAAKAELKMADEVQP